MAKVFTSMEEQCETWITQIKKCSSFSIDMPKLRASNCNITEIHPSIVALKNLNYIGMFKNSIKEIPKELCTMTQLKHLYLDKNLITNEGIPESFSNLTQLTHLAITDQLTSIPESFCDLINLQFLYLNDNDFSNAVFPDSLSNLTNLRSLHLVNTKLSTFPIEICTITSLTKIVINNNNICEIPEEISKLKSLSTFEKDNPISGPSLTYTIKSFESFNI
eukprot:TRINITY_DN5900_c0_g1_i1.p1 TRINITY_DN5900_c0_g1~~TRINITY_DN5900_c0_g1_i1.p1  ORF type:complete len:220 (+),score=31.78 TRINITY_DN5900_c0_g1_i1:85-744(+)